MGKLGRLQAGGVRFVRGNSLLEPVAELTIASKKNPLDLMASLGIPMGFMASLEAV
jgi:hypothetical protein